MRKPDIVYGYIRVSGAEQGRHGTSLEGQKDEQTRYCRTRGFPDPIFFVEVESGAAKRLEKRVELERLTKLAKRGNLILSTKVDRWSRDIVHGVQSVRDLVARGVGWHSTSEGIDASTSQGDSTLGIMAWAADNERRRIEERTVGRRRELRDQGLWTEGPPPLGYHVQGHRVGPDGSRTGHGPLVVAPGEADLVRELFRRARRESLPELAAWLHAVSTTPRHRDTVRRLLRSRVYLGEMRRSDGTWMPAHEPLVTLATWQAAQDALDARRLGGRRPIEDARTAAWLLRGLASCAACGGHMGAAYGAGGRDYYACSARLARRGCRAAYVRVDVADEAVAALVLERLAELRAELARSEPPPPADAVVVDYAAKRRALEARRERAIDMAEEGLTTREQLRERLAKIDRELAKLEEQESAAARSATARRPEVRQEVLGEVRELQRVWRRATVAQRREIVRLLARSIRLEAGAAPVVEWVPVEELAVDD